MSQTGKEYLGQLPLRALKIMRKGHRRKRKNPQVILYLKDINDIIKHKQAMPRPSFDPRYISRGMHRHTMAAK